MNVFEDLIEALKEDSLLESTVIDDAVETKVAAHNEIKVNADRSSFAAKPLGNAAAQIDFEISDDPGDDESPESKPSTREFFKKRAMDEVSSLQMVEHIFSGVEREHMKAVPVPFNDIRIKQALHRYSQITEDSSPDESNAAEFELTQQTQQWFSALADRDRKIAVGNVRRFVENSRPALSSQAMIALARFYRNSPYTDETRSKFDFVISRLFSREAEAGRRRLLFPRVEMVGHLKTLYETWSSVEVFTPSENSTEIGNAVDFFRQFASEADAAGTIDELLASGLFDRLREYKDGIGELFFAREVAAAAIDCNLRVGNKFVELVARVREKDVPVLEERFGDSVDQLVSNTTGRTLNLGELLRSEEIRSGVEEATEPEPQRQVQPEPVRTHTPAPKQAAKRFASFSVNKWLLAATILLVSISSGVYFWADKMASGAQTSSVAEEVDISATDLKQHLEKARSSNETLYGVTTPSWDGLSEEEKKEFLSKVVEFATQRGYTKVNLLNYRGRTVAFSSNLRFEILPPA
ncbi:MAG: hypothetical protein QUS14_16535 [Pyrinomonadaceae bacterium]|nr:hypothetical protein [Pyrinomonadaceae bacterium]